MSSTQTVSFDTLRSLPFGGISGAYAAVGSPFAHPIRLLVLTNTTDGSMFFSTDGTNDMLFLPKDSVKMFEFNTNRSKRDQIWMLQKGTQIFVKQLTAPTIGAVYVECAYGE